MLKFQFQNRFDFKQALTVLLGGKTKVIEDETEFEEEFYID